MVSFIRDVVVWLGHYSWDVIGGTPEAVQLWLGRHRWDTKGGTTEVVQRLGHYSWDVKGGTPEAGQQWLVRHRWDTKGGTTEVVQRGYWVHEISYEFLVGANSGCRISLEIRVSAVLFFPTPRFSHWVFTWKGFLRRQAYLVHQSPSKRWADVCALSCVFKWFFPIGVLVIVCTFICSA